MPVIIKKTIMTTTNTTTNKSKSQFLDLTNVTLGSFPSLNKASDYEKSGNFQFSAVLEITKTMFDQFNNIVNAAIQSPELQEKIAEFNAREQKKVASAAAKKQVYQAKTLSFWNPVFEKDGKYWVKVARKAKDANGNLVFPEVWNANGEQIAFKDGRGYDTLPTLDAGSILNVKVLVSDAWFMGERYGVKFVLLPYQIVKAVQYRKSGFGKVDATSTEVQSTESIEESVEDEARDMPF